MLLAFITSCLPTQVEVSADAFEDVFHAIPGTTPLIHGTRWEPVDPASDRVRAPELQVNDQCPPEAITLEATDDGLYLDIDTTACSWYTTQQPSLAALTKGDTLRVWAFRWANLTAEGQGRFVVSAGDPPEPLWEVFPELPDPNAALFYEDVTVLRDVPEGTPLYWHISNHGQNVWSLIQLLRVNAVADEDSDAP